MIRNLISNALKYTRHGKVLLGCRRRAGKLRIEVWDTGIGIADDELQAIFEEYHQIDNPARERSRGLGLGLSIVHRLGRLLGHEVEVRSRPGRGSVFAVEVNLAPGTPTAHAAQNLSGTVKETDDTSPRTGALLLIEDDPDVRELLEVFLRDEGHTVATAPDGPSALAMLEAETIKPDLVLADYNLPNGLNGVQTIERLRAQRHRIIPAIVLTGDILLGGVRDLALQHCVRLTKPVKLTELVLAIRHLLPLSGGEPQRECRETHRDRRHIQAADCLCR